LFYFGIKTQKIGGPTLKFLNLWFPAVGQRPARPYPWSAAGILAARSGVRTLDKRADVTADLEEIDVPTLILHGDDDQIGPFADSGALSAKLIEGSTLKLYPGTPHGMCETQRDPALGSKLTKAKSQGIFALNSILILRPKDQTASEPWL